MVMTRSKIAKQAEEYERSRAELYLKYTGKPLRKSPSLYINGALSAPSRSYGTKPFAPSQSMLLALPGEIRNMIYGYALAENSRLFLDTLSPPPLMAVSRQIRAEGLHIYVQVNRFHILLSVRTDLQTWTMDLSPITSSWLREVGLDKRLFNDIRLSFTAPDLTVTMMPDISIVIRGRTLVIEHVDCACLSCVFADATLLAKVARICPPMANGIRTILTHDDKFLALLGRLISFILSQNNGAFRMSSREVSMITSCFPLALESIFQKHQNVLKHMRKRFLADGVNLP